MIVSAQTNSQNICLIPQTLTQNIHGGRPTTQLSLSPLLTAG